MNSKSYFSDLYNFNILKCNSKITKYFIYDNKLFITFNNDNIFGINDKLFQEIILDFKLNDKYFLNLIIG